MFGTKNRFRLLKKIKHRKIWISILSSGCVLMTGLTATMTALYITNKTEKQDSPTGVKSDINFYLSGNVTYFTFDLPSIVSVFPRRSITFIEVRNQITTQDLGFVLTYGASRGLGSDITYDLVGNQTINVSYANFKYYVPSRGSNYALNSAYGMKFTCFILDSIEPNNNYLFWIWANFLFYGMST